MPGRHPSGKYTRSQNACGIVLLLLAAVFWISAGLAGADGDAGAAFAYSVAPLALFPVAGLIMADLERK